MSVVAKHFKEFPKAFSPAPIWWWSGERLERERLRWQMERFAEGGVYNLVILNLAPTGPLYGSDPDDPPFFSEAWWEIFKGVCEDAKKIGVSIWFYDQVGFSGANIQGELVKARPDFAGQSIERVFVDTAAAATLECPAGGKPVAACAMLLDAKGKPTGAPIPLDVEGNSVRWPGAAQSHRVMLFYSVDRGFDYFSTEACAALIDAIHGEFDRRVREYIGDVIVGSFQDELPSMPTWGRGFREAFQRLRGYDIVPYLAALWEDGGREGEKVRRDYHATRADLCEEAFFKPLFRWHEERGIICGFDQQGPARQGNPQRTVECYADYLRTHRWYGAPGSDHHGHAKIHSSLAHLYGRPRTWIEAFHSSGWGGTLEETFDWIVPWLRAGANLYNPHAVYYSTRGGWWEWAPPSTCWRQPYWKHYRIFSQAVSRLCAALSDGVHECDVGLLFPTATIQAGAKRDGLTQWAQEAQEAYRTLTGKMLWHDFKAGTFDLDRRDYDVLDDDSVQRATIEDGTLQVAGERYRAIVLPNCVVMESKTAEALLRFVEAGGLLVAVGDPPQRAAGMNGDEEAVAKLRAAFYDGRAILVEACESVPGALSRLPRPVEAPVPTLRRRVGGSTLVFVPATATQATRVRMVGPRYQQAYDFDRGRFARTMEVTVRGVQGAPLLWEPFSGKCRRLPYVQRDDGVTVTVPFDDCPAALLEWTEGDASGVAVDPAGGAAGALAGETAGKAGPVAGDPPATASTAAGAGKRVLAELDGAWSVELLSTLDNRYGDFDWPKGRPIPVQTWTARWLREDGPPSPAISDAAPPADDPRWAPVHMTFGPRGWRTDVLPESKLPAPLERFAPGDEASLTQGARVNWQPLVYSLSRGIYKDSSYQNTFGVNGHVPEEFFDFGDVEPGQGVQVRTLLIVDDDLSAHLAIGAAAKKQVWLNGEPVGGGGAGYLEILPVALRQGPNLLEIRLVADERARLRGHFALVRSPGAYVRPEWMRPEGAPMVDSVVRFSKTIDVPFAVRRARIQVGADAPCRLLVNGREAGRQGGFDPYNAKARVLPYDIAAFLGTGRNEIAIEVSDVGTPVAVLVDARIEGDGEFLILISDTTWNVERNGTPVPIGLRRRQWLDPAWSHLWRRPHPLPKANWLEEAGDPDAIVPAVAAPSTAERVEWFRIDIPPGALRASFEAHGRVKAFACGGDGREVRELPVERGDGLEHRIDLSGVPSPGSIVLRVTGAAGYSGGGVFESPVTFDVGPGEMTPGNWAEQGLSAFSGGVRYMRTVGLTQPLRPGERIVLDLGVVRGTAEVWVNGSCVGTRVLFPYEFDVTSHMKEGENQITVNIYNTLAPYLDAVSPTYFVFPGQTVSGLMGPVRLVAGS